MQRWVTVIIGETYLKQLHKNWKSKKGIPREQLAWDNYVLYLSRYISSTEQVGGATPRCNATCIAISLMTLSNGTGVGPAEQQCTIKRGKDHLEGLVKA
jgi:uncharacterized membrane protein YbaN (DUF454 family)